MPTREECQKIIFNLGIKLGCSPRLIATRLLSDLDKNDLMLGLTPIESLELCIKLWMDMGKPDMCNREGI